MNLKLIRKEKNNSYYELPKEIRDQILNFEKPNTSILKSYSEVLTFQRVLPNGKFLYENQDGDLITIAQDRAEKMAMDHIKQKSSEEFKDIVTNYLNKNVFPIKSGYAFILKAEKNTFHTIRFGGGNLYRVFGVSVGESTGGFYGTNTDGELVVSQNYLESTVEEDKVLTFQQAIDLTLKEIDSFVNIMKDSRGYYCIETSRGKYLLKPFEGKAPYSNDIECGFLTVYNVRDNVYYNSGESRNKITMKVKDLKPATNEELKQDFLERINKFFTQKEKYENIHCR